MPISRRSSALVALLVPVLAFAACGGDDADDSSSTGDSSVTTVADGPTTSTTTAKGKGAGTFTIAGTEFAFEAVPCRVSGSGDTAAVEAAGKGTADGKPFTVVVKRAATKDSVIENFQLVFSNTESIVGTNFVSLPSGSADSKIEVAGKKATGALTFLGTGGRPSGEGTFTVTCEA